MKFEYKTFTLRLEGTEEMRNAELTKTLNKFGSDGWELVTVNHSSSSYYYEVYLKRVIMDGKTL